MSDFPVNPVTEALGDWADSVDHIVDLETRQFSAFSEDAKCAIVNLIRAAYANAGEDDMPLNLADSVVLNASHLSHRELGFLVYGFLIIAVKNIERRRESHEDDDEDW